MLVDAVDTVGGCDSKTARDNTLFWSPMAAGSSDELAVVEHVGTLKGCKTTSFGVCGLA